MISKLAEKLQDAEYRKAFVASQINIGIPFQIRALLRSRRGWTQTTLAEKTDMLQPRVSALLTPGRTRPNIETLRRIAEAFDCGLIVRFAPFSELVKWSQDFDPETFNVPSFDADAGFIQRRAPARTFTAHRTEQELLEAAQGKNDVIVMRRPQSSLALCASGQR
jgi:transcriptional regulator with XRE-family HTH domain